MKFKVIYELRVHYSFQTLDKTASMEIGLELSSSIVLPDLKSGKTFACFHSFGTCLVRRGMLIKYGKGSARQLAASLS